MFPSLCGRCCKIHLLELHSRYGNFMRGWGGTERRCSLTHEMLLPILTMKILDDSSQDDQANVGASIRQSTDEGGARSMVDTLATPASALVYAVWELQASRISKKSKSNTNSTHRKTTSKTKHSYHWGSLLYKNLATI